MSSKGRKPVEEAEFYPTPREVVYALLDSPLLDLPGGLWIEPCAGTGRIIQAVGDRRKDVKWVACDIKTEFQNYLVDVLHKDDVLLPPMDFVTGKWKQPRAKVAIFNGPFSMTMQFVQTCMLRADWVVSLQRQGWFGTKCRVPWLIKHCPDFYQLPWRPSFRPDRATDSIEYCWYVWPPGSLDGRREGRVAMLDHPESGQQEMFGETE